jgi:hypothetical protein
MRLRLALLMLVFATLPALARGGCCSGSFDIRPFWEFAKFASFCLMLVALFYVFIGLLSALGRALVYSIAWATAIEQRATLKRYATRAWRWPAA